MDAPWREPVEAALGYRFVRPEHLAVAVTHRSSTLDGSHNETLEFLGDAVLALATADLLMNRFPAAREGDLSKARAALVNARVLAGKARMLDLGAWLRLGKGEIQSGGREKESILAAGYEAVLGAVYRDGGYEAARRVIESHFAADVAIDLPGLGLDYKTRLQEVSQFLYREVPTYGVVEESGPDHAKRFVVELTIGTRALARGVGRSKKAAEQEAARAGMALLRTEHPELDGRA